MRKGLVFLALAVLGLAWWLGRDIGDSPPPQTQPPVVLIFADVTNTLPPDEHQSLCKMVGCLIRQAPPRAQVHVYPLSKDVQEANLVAPVWTVPSLEDVGAERKIRDEAQKITAEALKKLQTLYVDANAQGAAHERTCIFDALRSAENILREKPQGAGQIHVVTDMVEDCKRSYNGTIVRLNAHDIQSQIGEASKWADQLLDLRGATVYFHVPRHDSTRERRNDPRPHIDQRKKFWEILVGKCGANGPRFYHKAFENCPEEEISAP